MSRKIRVGILGLGRAGRTMHVPELALFPESFEIKAGCDHTPDRLTNLPDGFQNAKLYSKYEDMLADPELDLINVATRNYDHTPHALMALEAGKAVVVEKPFAMTEEQGRALLEASKKYPNRIFLRSNRRFEPVFLQIMEIIKSGLLGKLSMIKLHRHPGFVRRFDWQTLTEFHGGLFNNWGPHYVDQALQMLGCPVKDVWCHLGHSVSGGDADDEIKLVLTGEDGCLVDIEISTSLTLPDRIYELRGNRGTLVLPLSEEYLHLKYLDPSTKFERLDGVRENFALKFGNPYEKLSFVEEKRPVVTDYSDILPEGSNLGDDLRFTFPAMWYHIYQALVNNKPYPVKVEEGFEVVKVMERAHKAANFQPSVLEY